MAPRATIGKKPAPSGPKRPLTRSETMARVKGKNTKPELTLRSALHARGFRFRIHRGDLPGRPDITLRRWNAVIFIDGCFWHGHAGCPNFRLPKSNADFWRAKIARNIERDAVARAALAAQGWRVLTVWECATRGRSPAEREALHDGVANWLRSGASSAEFHGLTAAPLPEPSGGG
jgi:DNA mismatch endonuclease (patch repair protein)